MRKRRCDLARQLLFRALVASSALVTAACGQGVAFGAAPGPPPPEPPEPPPPPPEDAGPDPEEDAGPPPPPTDAGPNCTIENRAATPAESLSEFTTQQLPTEYSDCASCHIGQSPTGTGSGWGATTDDAAGWHEAAVALADRDSALAPNQTALYTHFAGVNGTHGDNPTAKTGMLDWLDLYRNGVDEEVCEDPPDVCEPTYRDPTPTEIEADFNTRNIAADFSCASCHVGQSPTGTGSGWGAPTDDAAGWFAACDAIADRDAALAVDQTALYTHFNGINGTHGVKAPERDRMSAWLTFRRTQIEEPGDCEEPEVDAGPGIDCTPVPVDAAGSEAEFVAQDLPTPYNNCANCHVGKSPDGNGINWGPDNNNPTPADWHTAARTLWDGEGLADPQQSALYSHFNGVNATHPANADAAGGVDAWLTYISSPQPPEGCE